MSMKLSAEKEYLVLENQNLVHYLVRNLGVFPNFPEYEDIVSIGTIGLVKAAITFDASKKYAFTTYAAKCINNEILMYYRKTKKYANVISMNEVIVTDKEGNKSTLEDTIADPNSNFVEKIINKESLIQLTSIVLNYLKGKNRIIMLYRMGNMTQKSIGDMLGISRTRVSKIESKSILKIREVADHSIPYKEVFSMEIIGNVYKISFSSKDFCNAFEKVTSVKNSLTFKVTCRRERIIIQMPAHSDSFSFMAQIIQKIDDFSMPSVSNKSISPSDHTVSLTSKSKQWLTLDKNNAIKKALLVKQQDISIPSKNS